MNSYILRQCDPTPEKISWIGNTQLEYVGFRTDRRGTSLPVKIRTSLTKKRKITVAGFVTQGTRI